MEEIEIEHISSDEVINTRTDRKLDNKYIKALYVSPWELPVVCYFINNLSAREVFIWWYKQYKEDTVWAYLRYKWEYLIYYNEKWIECWFEFNRILWNHKLVWPFLIFWTEWKWVLKDSSLTLTQILDLKIEFWEKSLIRTKEFLNTEEWLLYK